MTKTAILSVLKPVDDVRSYQRIASHLLPKSKQVVCIGFEGQTQPSQNNIRFLELFNHRKHHNRLGLWRFWAGWKVFFCLLREKPSQIIVSAAELIPFVGLYRLLRSFYWVYDVQENYAFNIRYQDNYPSSIKRVLAFGIQSTEAFFSKWADEFWLAEQCYLEEIPYLKRAYLRDKRKKVRFVENKYLAPASFKFRHQVTEGSELRKILIYGYFSKAYGTLEGVHLFEKLQQLSPTYSLTLAGYANDKSYLSELKRITAVIPNIEWFTDGTTSIAHHQLMELLSDVDLVLLPYLPNESTKNCIPSKFYECIAYQKPMLVRQNARWETFLSPIQSAIFFDEHSDVEALKKTLDSTTFYPKKVDESVWRFEY